MDPMGRDADTKERYLVVVVRSWYVMRAGPTLAER